MATQAQVTERKAAREQQINSVRERREQAREQLAELESTRITLQRSISVLGQEMYELAAGAWQDES